MLRINLPVMLWTWIMQIPNIWKINSIRFCSLLFKLSFGIQCSEVCLLPLYLNLFYVTVRVCYPYLPLDLTDANEKDIKKPEAHFREYIQSQSETEDLQGEQQRSMHKRHEDVMELTVSCCTIGCSESHIRSLC